MITATQYLKRYPADEQFVGPDATVLDILKSDVTFNHKASLFAEVYVENALNRVETKELDENGDWTGDFIPGPIAPFIQELMDSVAKDHPYATRPGVANVSQQPARDAYFNLEHYVKDWSYQPQYQNKQVQKFHLHAALNIMDKIGLNRLEQMIEVVEAIQKGGRV